MREDHLYTIQRGVKCLHCGCRGAVQYYGKYYPEGYPQKQANSFAPPPGPYLSHAIGLGGTIPHECLNCGNKGLIDTGGLEGYKQAFQTIKM